MIIRLIKPNDAADFLELVKKVDESGTMLYEPGERQTTLKQQSRIIDNILADKYSDFLVAEIDEELVGYMMLQGNKAKRQQHVAYLVLGVDEAFQGLGIATKLFETAFVWAKRNKITRLELTVIKNNVKAISLYKKMGFVLEGEKIHSLMIDGKPVNEYYLYKLL